MIPEMVIGAIVEMGVEGVRETVKRREAILRVLKELGYNLDEPPSDFDGLYAYALVEYGVGKPRQILDLFRYEVIREAFRCAFEQRDRTVFDEEMEAFLGSERGQEIYQLDYEPKREYIKFQAVFEKLADRARTVPEVKQDHKLDDIHNAVQQLLHSFEDLSVSESDTSKATPVKLPRLTLKIFQHGDRQYRDRITFRQPNDSSPFRFGLALVNTVESTVAKEIDITIYISWQGGVVPRLTPIFQTSNGEGWEFHHDRIKFWEEAVLRFRGSERDRCPSGQPLEWNFLLILRERLIGEFLLSYRISSIPQERESSGELKIRMG